MLVIADASANPAFVAADLLSQAEHGPDSQVILLTDSETLLHEVVTELERQLPRLPRAEIARRALTESRGLLLPDVAAMLDFSNQYAPEHLILAVAAPEQLAAAIYNAGSVFMGHLTPEAVGDYASGTNHTLPTGGLRPRLQWRVARLILQENHLPAARARRPACPGPGSRADG